MGFTDGCELTLSGKRNATSNPIFTHNTPHTNTNIMLWRFVDKNEIFCRPVNFILRANLFIY